MWSLDYNQKARLYPIEAGFLIDLDSLTYKKFANAPKNI